MPGKPTHQVVAFGLAGGYLVALFVLGSLQVEVTGPVALSDKWLHLLGFGLFTLLAARAVRALLPARPVLSIALAVALAAVFGGLLELWQSFLGYRSAELLDWVADCTGALLFGFAAWLLGLRLEPARDSAPSASR